jgi:hypothetical protein
LIAAKAANSSGVDMPPIRGWVATASHLDRDLIAHMSELEKRRGRSVVGWIRSFAE